MRPTHPLRLVLAGVVAIAFAAGLLAPLGVHGAVAADPDLTTLLRFMAVIKGGMALAAAGLLSWRLRTPVQPLAAVAAIGAVALMAAATGLIWSLAHVALAAALFHVGLLGLLALAWREGLPARLPRLLMARANAVRHQTTVADLVTGLGAVPDADNLNSGRSHAVHNNIRPYAAKLSRSGHPARPTPV